MVDINAIMKELRTTKVRERREEVNKKFTPLGKTAWKKREKKKRALEDKELEQEHGRKMAQLRYYRRNKKELNRKRAIRDRQPQQVYKRTKRRAEGKGQRWEFDFPTWWEMWESAPKVVDETTGLKKSAWKMKGGNPFKHTQMYRRDTEGPWQEDNCYIGYRDEELEDG